jgi:hypothetical protein
VVSKAISDLSALIFRVTIGVKKSTNDENLLIFYGDNSKNHQENHNGIENA